MTTVPLNDLLYGYTVDPDAAPEMLVEIDDVRWQRAEPDVGIMSAYPDDWSETFYADADKWVNNRQGFVVSLLERGVLEGDADEISKLIEQEIRAFVDELEND